VQAGCNQKVYDHRQQQCRADADQQHHVAQGLALIEIFVDPATGKHGPPPGRRSRGIAQLFAQLPIRLRQGIASGTVLSLQQLANTALDHRRRIDLGQSLVLILGMLHELTAPLVVGRPDDEDIAGLAGDNLPELPAQALELALERQSDRVRPPDLARWIAQQLDRTEEIAAAANPQPLVVLSGKHRTGNRITIRQGNAVHRPVLLVAQQGSQAVNLTLLQQQERPLVAGVLAKGGEHALVAIEQFAAQANQRQFHFAGSDQAGPRLRHTAKILDEELGLAFAARLDRLEQGVQRRSHQLGLVLQVLFGHAQGGPARPLFDQPDHATEDQQHRQQNHQDQLLSQRSLHKTLFHTPPERFNI